MADFRARIQALRDRIETSRHLDPADPTTPIHCVRCEQKTPRERDTCVWCGAALSQEAAQKLEAQRDRAMQTIREADDSVADSAMAVERKLGKVPGLRSVSLDRE